MAEILRNYWLSVRSFSRGARLYLLSSVLRGIGFGIFQLFFNFYILSLGYRRDFLGLLISLPSITALVVALFAGYISDLIGRKRAFISGMVVMVIAQMLMLFWITPTGLILSGILRGMGGSLYRITSAPFLMEESGERERTHLFSFSAGLSTVSSFLGNFLGGSLPGLVALYLGVAPTSSTAYAWSLGATTLLMLVSLLPLSRLEVRARLETHGPLEPFRTLWKHRRELGKLLLPPLITSLGAGMLIPFLNVFFRYRYGLPDEQIGSLFGFGALGMGVATLLAPILAERLGKPQTVVLTRALSIPLLIVLGFVYSLPLAIGAFLLRMALMNLAGPVYQTMVMEEIDEGARGMAASLYGMIWNLGRAVTPSISGPIQERYGFDPVFLTTIAAYAIGTFFLYWWFVRPARGRVPRTA